MTTERSLKSKAIKIQRFYVTLKARERAKIYMV